MKKFIDWFHQKIAQIVKPFFIGFNEELNNKKHVHVFQTKEHEKKDIYLINQCIYCKKSLQQILEEFEKENNGKL